MELSPPSWPDKAKAKARELIDRAPSEAVKVVRNGVGAAAAGLVADRVFKATISKGPIPAVAAAVGGAAVTRGAIEAGFELSTNIYRDLPTWGGVGKSALDGMRKGAINGGITLAAAPILKHVTTHHPHLTAAKAGAIAGSVRGGLSSFMGNATNPDTWQKGGRNGTLKVAGATLAGMAGGYVSGGALKHLEKYIDFTSLDLDWLSWDAIVDAVKPG